MQSYSVTSSDAEQEKEYTPINIMLQSSRTSCRPKTRVIRSPSTASCDHCPTKLSLDELENPVRIQPPKQGATLHRMKGVTNTHKGKKAVQQQQQQQQQQEQRYEIPNEVPFPLRLHIMLQQIESFGQAHIVSWMPSGRSFRVHDKEGFSREVLPKFFRSRNFRSFQRNLSVYQFSRIWAGPEKGAYWHDNFVRDDRMLCTEMKRHVPISQKNKDAAGSIEELDEDLDDSKHKPQPVHLQQQQREWWDDDDEAKKTTTSPARTADNVAFDHDGGGGGGGGGSPKTAGGWHQQVLLGGLTMQPYHNHDAAPPRQQEILSSAFATLPPPATSSLPPAREASRGTRGGGVNFGRTATMYFACNNDFGSCLPASAVFYESSPTVGVGQQHEAPLADFSSSWKGQEPPHHDQQQYWQQAQLHRNDELLQSQQQEQDDDDDDPFLLDRLWSQTLNAGMASKNPQLAFGQSFFLRGGSGADADEDDGSGGSKTPADTTKLLSHSTTRSSSSFSTTTRTTKDLTVMMMGSIGGGTADAGGGAAFSGVGGTTTPWDTTRNDKTKRNVVVSRRTAGGAGGEESSIYVPREDDSMTAAITPSPFDDLWPE